MPHLSVYAAETDLAGREQELIAALTDAVAAVYGDWARPIAVVRLHGVPAGRWGIGGTPAAAPAPAVTFGIKEAAFTRPEMIEHLAEGVTGALATVLGEHHRAATTVDFTGTAPGRSAVGGVLTD